MTISQTTSNEVNNQLPTVSELLSIEIAAHSNLKATLESMSRRYTNIEEQLRSQQEATSRWYKACGSATRSFQQSSDLVTSLREENQMLKHRLRMIEEELQVMRSKVNLSYYSVSLAN